MSDNTLSAPRGLTAETLSDTTGRGLSLAPPYRCPECGAFWYDGRESHGVTADGKVCPKQSVEHLWRTAQLYYEAWVGERQQHTATRVRLHQYATSVQGKWAILKHENNKLRSKLKKDNFLPSQK